MPLRCIASWAFVKSHLIVSTRSRAVRTCRWSCKTFYCRVRRERREGRRFVDNPGPPSLSPRTLRSQRFNEIKECCMKTILTCCLLLITVSGFAATPKVVPSKCVGESVRGTVYTPEGKGPFPALIVIHE